ncbi:hypothetical protein ACTMU2_11095 [Cupriavidus basilensis]
MEPVEHVVFLMIVHGVLQHHAISGADTPLFIGLGVLGFFLMRNITLRGMDAVSADSALFAYRQVRAVDTIVARAVLEALLKRCGGRAAIGRLRTVRHRDCAFEPAYVPGGGRRPVVDRDRSGISCCRWLRCWCPNWHSLRR